jgi:hypothetical protein
MIFFLLLPGFFASLFYLFFLDSFQIFLLLIVMVSIDPRAQIEIEVIPNIKIELLDLPIDIAALSHPALYHPYTETG